jgi:hypothetical protein
MGKKKTLRGREKDLLTCQNTRESENLNDFTLYSTACEA